MIEDYTDNAADFGQNKPVTGNSSENGSGNSKRIEIGSCDRLHCSIHAQSRTENAATGNTVNVIF
jgi:hypothetical protein